MAIELSNLVKGMKAVQTILMALIALAATGVVGYLVVGGMIGVATNGTITIVDSRFNNSLNDTWSVEVLGFFEQIPDAVKVIIGLIALVVLILVFRNYLGGSGSSSKGAKF